MDLRVIWDWFQYKTILEFAIRTVLRHTDRPRSMNLEFQWSKCGLTTLDLGHGSHGFSKLPSRGQHKHHEKLPQSFCRNSLKIVVCAFLLAQNVCQSGQEVYLIHLCDLPIRHFDVVRPWSVFLRKFQEIVVQRSLRFYLRLRSQMRHFLRIWRHLLWGVESSHVSWPCSNQRELCPSKWCAL